MSDDKYKSVFGADNLNKLHENQEESHQTGTLV